MFEEDHFSKKLILSLRKSLKFGALQGIGLGFMMCMMYK